MELSELSCCIGCGRINIAPTKFSGASARRAVPKIAPLEYPTTSMSFKPPHKTLGRYAFPGESYKFFVRYGAIRSPFEESEAYTIRK